MKPKPTCEELEKRVSELENRLLESETRFEQLVKHAPTGIYEIDLVNYRFTSINNIMCDVTGYTREEILSMDARLLLTEESRRHQMDRHRRLLAGENIHDSTEFQIRTKEGRELWALTTSRFYFENGKPTRATVVISDISRQKSTECALRESEALFRCLVDNMLDGCVIIDWNATVFFVNHAAVKFVGLDSPEEALGCSIAEFVHPESMAVVAADLELVKHGQGGFLAEYRMITPTGDNKWIEALGTKIIFKGREADLIIGRDITARKQAEQERNRLEVQLHQSRKMESIGTLAGGIAHDFNNLLMTIQGNASLMLYDLDPTHPHHQLLTNIENSIKSGAQLTTQLLGFARKGRYQVGPLNLNGLIEETADTFARAKKEITIHRELSQDLFGVMADKGQIQQVLLNLLINAADAMPDGGDVSLKTENVTHDTMKSGPYSPTPGAYVRLTVTDTGTGMDKETMQRIFEPFFTTKEMSRGTGLGLASVFGIIKGHRGYIDVESEEGQGSTFTIYLPASDQRIGNFPEAPQSHERIVAASGNILLVDDEAMVLEAAVLMLRRLSCTVLTAKSGREAVEIYTRNKEKIDAVILDMIMPEVGGGKVYDRLKEINPNVKVLLSSGYSIDGQATEILKRGCDGFIQKPFSMHELSAKLREILS